MNPTSQFIVKKLYELQVFGYDISVTNSSLAMFLATLSITGILSMRSAPLELVYKFLADMLSEYAGKQALVYLPLVIAIFFTVLMGNLIGLIPGMYTFTSQLIITLTLALITFISIIVIGFKEKGLGFFKMFVHGNMPLPITLFIIPIEIISFFARPLSLCLRLCINMIAGHMTLKIFASFASLLPASSVIIIPLLIVLTVFEILVAILQAYIFSMLSCIYLSEVTSHSDH